MNARTVALAGATGGAGTTRSCLELATALAAAGDDVAVLDAAYDTQGLARHLPGRLDPDVTTLVVDDADEPLSTGFVEYEAATGPDTATAIDAEERPEPGRVACCPARAPFERLARAKSPEAAKELEARIAEASSSFDYVLVDTPPLGSNPAIAAVTTADRVGVVSPATEHGHDAVQQTRGRLQDVGTAADAVVAVELFDNGAFPEADADVRLPAFDGAAPSGLETEAGVRALETLADAVLDTELDLPVAESGLTERLGSIGN
jgi:cellulose biosynthesis protein BcsQ